jgi:hypothetical protein
MGEVAVKGYTPPVGEGSATTLSADIKRTQRLGLG